MEKVFQKMSMATTKQIKDIELENDQQNRKK
jgi:hypothetical protein